MSGSLGSRYPDLYGKPCHYCGNESDTLDHFVPRALGGGTNRRNLVPCCTACNKRKRDLHPDDFARLLVEGDPMRGERGIARVVEFVNDSPGWLSSKEIRRGVGDRFGVMPSKRWIGKHLPRLARRGLVRRRTVADGKRVGHFYARSPQREET